MMMYQLPMLISDQDDQRAAGDEVAAAPTARSRPYGLSTVSLVIGDAVIGAGAGVAAEAVSAAGGGVAVAAAVASGAEAGWANAADGATAQANENASAKAAVVAFALTGRWIALIGLLSFY